MRPMNRILLIDDDPMSNMINEKIIQQSKLTLKVDSYSDANAALKYLRKLAKINPAKFPTIIFLDINMPEVDGWEFLEELVKLPESIFSELKIFMLTSSIDHEDIEKSKLYKIVQGFISKPLTVDKIDALFTSPRMAIAS